MFGSIYPLNSSHKVSIIGASLGWGAQIHETEHGPDYLYASLLKKKMNQQGFDPKWQNVLYPVIRKSDQIEALKKDEVLNLIEDFVSRLSDQVKSVILEDNFPLIFGGDHSLAIGTWSGVTQALNAHQQFGLLWMDAHMDSHTPETSPSQAYHGMPVATLMGYGEACLTDLTKSCAKLDPAHVVLYGIRSYEPEEKTLLDRLKVRIYYMDEINQRGIDQTMNEAVDYLNQNTKGFGISLDLDVFDPAEVPGVGSPEFGGLPVEETLDVLSQIVPNLQLRAFEVTEFNPCRDYDDKTLYAAQKIIEMIVKGKALNKSKEKIYA
ncbi:MAG: arginase [Janthinobacterium lividum]